MSKTTMSGFGLIIFALALVVRRLAEIAEIALTITLGAALFWAGYVVFVLVVG